MNEQKSLYGIIGFPLAHSLSPLMHNTAFKELGVDAEYKAFSLKDSELDGFFSKLKEKDSPIFGLNVTVPYKEKVLKYLDSVSPLAEKIKAVNTITISPKRKLVGFNTDAPGFMAHLDELQFDVKDKTIVVLGAGGSTRAILAALCLIPDRPKAVQIYNRTREKLDGLVSELGRRLNMSIVEKVYEIDDLNIWGADLLINTTSLGLNEDDECLIDGEDLHPNLLVYDLIYNPAETKLLSLAKKKGCKVSNGLGMLYYQGALSLEHWAETEIGAPVKKKMRESLESWLKANAVKGK
jgi:shikimate dehydrogenase